MLSVRKVFLLKEFTHLSLMHAVVLLLLFQSNLYSQNNTSIELTGGFAKSQENGMGTILTFSKRITGNLFLTASTGYLSFENSDNDYIPFINSPFEKIISREKYIIPLEIGGVIEFGEQRFRPFIKFGVGYNYTEYNIYEHQKSGEGDNSQPKILKEYRTNISAGYGIGMGASYFINPELRLGINFMMHQVEDVNRYIRLMAGVSYII